MPKATRKTIGDRAFAHSGSPLWEKLPLELPSSPNVKIFKSKLKTYLLKLAYDYSKLILSGYIFSNYSMSAVGYEMVNS